MAGEVNKITIKATAKLEKFDDNITKEDIETGKAEPYEILSSEDVLTDPTKEQLLKLQNMGLKIPKEAWEQVEKPNLRR